MCLSSTTSGESTWELAVVWKIVWKVMQGWSYAGMSKVLEYEATLELKDRGGKKDTFKKREKVRHPQDSVRACARPYLALAALDVYALWRFILPALT